MKKINLIKEKVDWESQSKKGMWDTLQEVPKAPDHHHHNYHHHFQSKADKLCIQ